jgi:pyruvate formate lyase activating enzyme
LKMAQYLADKNHPTWIRYVLVPGFSDDLDDIKNLAQFLKPMTNIQKVQILPFHKMGEYKWKELGLNYELSATEPPTAELVQQVTEIFQEHNLKTE